MTATDRKRRVARETLEDGLTLLWLDVDANDGSESSSELYERLHLSIRETAARLVFGVDGDDEYQRLCDLESELEWLIRTRIVDWAESLLAARVEEPPSANAPLHAPANPEGHGDDSIPLARRWPTPVRKLLSVSVGLAPTTSTGPDK